MRQRISSLLFLVLACVLAAGCGGKGSGSSACSTPTAAQCKDATWLSTDRCGMAEREAMRTNPQATCNQVVVAATEEATADIVPETVVDPRSGGTTEAKVLPNADDGLNTLVMPLTQVGQEQQTAMNATAAGLSPADQALRAQWEANGNRVASCREYVYEKYFDLRRFEDAVAARHDAFPYVYDVAFGPAGVSTSIGSRVASGQTLKMRDGSPMSLQTVDTRLSYPIGDCAPSYGPAGTEYLVKNIFFALPLSLFQHVKAQVDPNLEMTMTYSRCYDRADFGPTLGASWSWHRDRRAAVLARGISLAEMAAKYADVKAFRQALVEYDRPQPVCCVTEPSLPCCSDYRAARASLEAQLEEQFLRAYAGGCLDPAVASVCDWSPELFVEGLRTPFGEAMEADYQRCLDLTGDDFAPLVAKMFYMPTGAPWRATPTDYTVTASAIDQYFRDQAQWLAEFWLALPADVKDPVTGHIRSPGGEKSAHHEAGNSLFSAYYDYLLAWGMPGFGPHPANPQTGVVPPGPCVKKLEARGSFTAGAKAFGSVQLEVLDASFAQDLVTGVGGHLSVLGVQIWGRAPTTEWIILANAFEVSKPLLQKSRTFTIAYIPVTVAGGISGTLHLEREFAVSSGVGPLGDGCYTFANFDARFRPWVRLEAFASAAVGTAVASAGIECALTLLRLETPFTLGVDLALDGAKLRLTPSASGDLVMRTLDGRISLFVKVDLGLFETGYSYDVFRWSGLRAQLPLFRTSYTLLLDEVVPLMSVPGT